MERKQAAERWMNKYMRLLDYSGTRVDGAVHGYGGLGEVRQALEYHQDAAKLPIGCVVLDWAGMAVDRYVRTLNPRNLDSALFQELKNYVDQAATTIAKHFCCPVWVVHQINAVSLKRGSAAELTHADALGCGSFAMPAMFACILRNQDLTTHTCTMAFTKTRRGEPQPATICKNDGDFGQLIEANKEYVVDRSSGRIVRQQDAASVIDLRRPRAMITDVDENYARNDINAHVAADVNQCD
jgi:hypothetical protein